MGNTHLDYLCIGHSCHDKVGDRYILGGTASYSSIVAKQLGVNVGVLTSVGDDFEFFNTFKEKDIPLVYKKADKTTVFENIYQGTQRIQYIHARAEVLQPQDVPQEWRDTPIVQFGSIAAEMDFSLFKAFPKALKGVTIQGWLRQWDSKGLISPKAMDWSQLQAVDVVIMSDADIQGFESAIPEIISYSKVLVMTEGANGAKVFSEGKVLHFPAYPILEVDSTGAGDVFTAAFLIKYAETHDLALATAFAHSAASFVVEGVGINNLTTIQERINDRFEDYQRRFFRD